MKKIEKDLLEGEIKDVVIPDFDKFKERIDFSRFTAKRVNIKFNLAISFGLTLILISILIPVLMCLPKNPRVSYYSLDVPFASYSEKELYNYFTYAFIAQVDEESKTTCKDAFPYTTMHIRILQNFKGQFNEETITYVGGEYEGTIILPLGEDELPKAPNVYLFLLNDDEIIDHRMVVDLKGYDLSLPLAMQNDTVLSVINKYQDK